MGQVNLPYQNIATTANSVHVIGNPLTRVVGYCPETRTALAAMTVKPLDIEKGVLDRLIQRMIYSGNWAELDFIQIYAQGSTQGTQATLLNIKNPATYTATLMNSPVWTAGKGYSGDVAANNRYIKTGFIPSAGTKFQVGDSCLFAFNQKNLTTRLPYQCILGSYDGSKSDQLLATAPTPATIWLGALHNNNSVTNTGPRNDGLLSSINNFTDMTNTYDFRNGKIVASGGISSNLTRSTRELYSLARNDSGTPNLHAYSSQVSLVGAGSSQINQQQLYAEINEYLTFFGANVLE